ncbi:hypothetical protein [Streptomyces sp. NPDC058295]|jgi:hypothetical protein|uniref:hypothetical protein n=1 Tax=Streptomyces sp. NPDC058295 TaxID=3346431 RepID=UPI0036E33F7E
MSTFYDYFSAPDDRLAIADFDRRDLEVRPLSPLSVKGIDPYVVLGKGQSLLTGLPYDEVVRLPRFCQLLTEEEADRLLVTVADELRDAVATATPDRFRRTAESWSCIEEFAPGGHPEGLFGFLTQLAALAVPARAEGYHLYCEFTV